MRRSPVLALLALVAAVALGGCTTEPPAPPAAEPTIDPSPLASYDTGTIAVVRAPFCDRLSSDAVRDALGDAADDTAAWGPGDALPDGERDVSHEWGCRFSTSTGLVATAWLFTPPVTAAQARGVLRETKGCTRQDGTDFGRPSAATRCEEDGVVEVGYRGLFGDAWLSCTVAAPRSDVPEDLDGRANRWCAQALEATRVR